MRAALIVVAAAAVTVGLLWWSWQSFGPESIAFAFLVVWVPMAALGTASHFVTIRLPERCHRLRGWELRSRVYELLGVRVAKRMLRRGPLSVFNPHLHLPPTPDAARVVALDARMREAEASHAVLFVLEVAVAMHAVERVVAGSAVHARVRHHHERLPRDAAALQPSAAPPTLRRGRSTYRRVRISGPWSPTSTVCSTCAANDPSAVAIVQPSSR